MTNLPAYLQNLPSRNVAQVAINNVGAGNPPHLSIAGGRFTLVDVAGNTIQVPQFHIDVVIVDVNDHISKIFFGKDKPYEPGNPTPPICFSDNGVAPSVSAGQPQSATCASCPNNVWGSKISQMGSAVKACADQQKIAIYAPEYSDGLFLLRIPPGSFINWRGYMAKFAQANLDPSWVLTRIAFEQGVIGTLTFQSPGYITEQQAGVVAKMFVAKAADQLIGRMDRPRQGLIAGAAAAVAPSGPAMNVQFTDPPIPQTPPANIPIAGGPVHSPGEPVQRRRGRRPAASSQPQAPAQPAQAPFPHTASPAPFQPDSPPQAQFGMVQNPPAPPPGLDLDAVFKS